MGISSTTLRPLADETTITNASGSFALKTGGVAYSYLGTDVTTLLNRVQQVYSGTGFNTTSSGTTEASYELTALTPTQLTGATYVKITETFRCLADTSSFVQFKIQEKYTGGSYADDLAYVDVLHDQGDSDDLRMTASIIWYHTLTANDKANGCQFKIFSKSTGASSSFNNIQTVVELA